MTAGAAPETQKGHKPGSFAKFDQQVKDYMSLRKKIARDLPKLSDKSSPEEISQNKIKLQEGIRANRADAKPGEILGADIFEVISAVRSETGGKAGVEARDAVLGDGNPAKEGEAFTPRVNAPYPEDAPLSTVTPEMLAKLPKLPEGLEFRFVGRTLILYDSEADLVVDYVSGVVKGAPKK
jgi:hypothetical protein